MIKLQTIPDPLKPLTQYSQWVIWERIPMRILNGKHTRRRDLEKAGFSPEQIDALPVSERTEKITVHPSTLRYHNAHDTAIQTDALTALSTAAALPERYGVGFVFTEADPFYFVDVDSCLDASTSTWSARANELKARLSGACVEVSQSGRGLHIIGTCGQLPPRSVKYSNEFDLYTERRFVALTGTDAYGDASTDCTQALTEICIQYLPPRVVAAPSEATDGPDPDWNGHTDDGELIEHAQTSVSAMHALTGKATFADLWNGNGPALGRTYLDDNGREYDASKADMALAQHLAFWTGRDAGRIERLMRQSALARDKWDEREGYYLPRTIGIACERQREVHTRDTGIRQSTDIRELTDLGNAERLTDQHGDSVRYVPEWGWLCWDGTRWARDTGDLQVGKLAAKVVRGIREEANKLQPPEFYERITKHAIRSEGVSRIDAMVTLARPRARAAVKDFDNQPLLFNVANGTLDLSTGQFKEHNRTDFITQCSSVRFDSTAKCPQWDAFLGRILPDPNVRAYVQRAAGYSTTGETGEQVLFFCHGSGANGKSTFIETIMYIFGDYATTTPPGLLLASRGDQKMLETASVHGKRFAAAQETGAGNRLDEAQVKRLTGGDTLTGKILYHNAFTFKPTHKLWLASNHKPIIRDSDHAIWRRLHLIPFNETIPSDEIDPALGQKLKTEASGILNWLIRGAKLWKATGLKAPNAVIEAVNEYRSDEDIVGQWLEDNTAKNTTGEVPTNVIYANFCQWCMQQGIKSTMSQKMLANILKERGFKNKRTGQGRVWVGLQIIRGAMTLMQ